MFAWFAVMAAAGGAPPPHPENLASPVPAEGVLAHVNPPSLRWPLVKGGKVRYSVRLSQNKEFKDPGSFQASELRWALYNPHRQLESGTWYWQFAVIEKEGKKPQWSPVLQFRVDDTVRAFVTPPASTILAAAKAPRPRIPMADAPTGKQDMRDLARLIAKPIPSLEKANPKDTGKNDFEKKKFAQWASKGWANETKGSVRRLVQAYRTTGEERFGRRALEYGLFVAGLDPDGVTSHKVSDFANGSCMQVLAQVYDGCYELMTSPQRQQMRDALALRTSRFFASKFNSLESKVFSAHTWQHILTQATEAALTLIGDEPQAETWLAYVYELWIAKFPGLSSTDGAWANGINYFGTNFATMLEMPVLFGRLAGVDFFDHPWFRNTPYYLLYCWPPNSVSDGFGDGSERNLPPSKTRGEFVKELGTHFKDPHALWYAEQILGKLDSPPVAPKAPVALPQSRVFNDAGLVSMHTELADVTCDLMVSFRSSPYGAYNHMHSDQNSFNVNWGGERLFCGSGYYIGYSDDHFKGWYTHTQGHNSVMLDGKGQLRGSAGFGRIVDFKDEPVTSYCVGDASHAYGSDAGLRTFHRHLLLLRPSTLLVYDELEAGHQANWEWLLHSSHELKIADGALLGGNSKSNTRVDLFASTPLATDIHTRFDPPAVNWRKKTSGGKILEYPDQWHFTATPESKQERLRVLAVIQVEPKDATKPMSAARLQDGTVSIAGKKVQVEMSPLKPAKIRLR